MVEESGVRLVLGGGLARFFARLLCWILLSSGCTGREWFSSSVRSQMCGCPHVVVVVFAR